ncbi:MAG: succinate dehydrogenase, cytochrome b556 subunit [Pseudomonadales bacterium]|nr:succinate dehydrogenase, cytochrome b556 subunit [Pseudomonadales bacterium]
MKTDRPVNLNIFTITLPFVGVASFTHRVTGMILFVGFAFGLYALQLALSSPEGFAEAATLSDSVLGRIIFVGLIFALSYHVLAGIKHLLLDFHIGDTFEAQKVASLIVLVLAVIDTVVFGVLLW